MSEHQTPPKLMAIAQAIVEELNAIDGHTWTALNGCSQLAYLQGTDGRRFSLRTTGYRFQHGDRLEISGSYPRKEGNYGYISSHNDPPSIGVTSSRSPKAKDVKRRFLPKFHEFHELAMERKRRHEEYVANQQQAGKLIAEAFDGELRRDRVHFGSAINDRAWGHVDVSGIGTVMIEMGNVPVKLAVRIGHSLRRR